MRLIARRPESDAAITRRQFGAVAGSLLLPFALVDACADSLDFSISAVDGRLSVRPPTTRVTTTAKGTRLLGLGASRDAILQVPPKSTGPLPLLVLLHGAGGGGERMLQRLESAPDTAGVAVLSPDSRGTTWDAIRGDFGSDVTFLNRALERVFQIVDVDPARLTIGGFSDGATYGLSLGLINGDLFKRIVAFSPGFVVEGPAHGKPRIFISHGTDDPILPIDQCSRVIVPALKRRGYDVTFREFNGRHEVPAPVAAEAMSWIAAPPA
jgi:predicted esterase